MYKSENNAIAQERKTSIRSDYFDLVLYMCRNRTAYFRLLLIRPKSQAHVDTIAFSLHINGKAATTPLAPAASQTSNAPEICIQRQLKQKIN